MSEGSNLQKALVVMIRFILVICSISIIAGCSDQQSEGYETKKLEVQIRSNKEQIKVNEPVKFIATIKYGDKEITEEATVKFEVIENDASSGLLEAIHEGKGTYTLETMFLSAGQHKVVSHVDYKGLHEMPSLSLHASE